MIILIILSFMCSIFNDRVYQQVRSKIEFHTSHPWKAYRDPQEFGVLAILCHPMHPVHFEFTTTGDSLIQICQYLLLKKKDIKKQREDRGMPSGAVIMMALISLKEKILETICLETTSPQNLLFSISLRNNEQQ